MSNIPNCFKDLIKSCMKISTEIPIVNPVEPPNQGNQVALAKCIVHYLQNICLVSTEVTLIYLDLLSNKLYLGSFASRMSKWYLFRKYRHSMHIPIHVQL